jgi:signal transduction histidine kinase
VKRHGILGATDFLSNTHLDAFQSGMLHSIGTCGRTLLDTLNHIMDFAKINQFSNHQTQTRTVTQFKGPDSIRISATRIKGRSIADVTHLATTFDLSKVTEEVVESVYASQSYLMPYTGLNEDNSAAGFATSTQTQLTNMQQPKPHSERKLVLVILDIPHQPNWRFYMAAGAWRRIIMNLVGNALKYTHTGFIRISLRATKTAPRLNSKETQIVLSVTDSGIGISREFLANKLFTAFSQEDGLSSGVGLGLHIVRQLVETTGGKIDLRSQIGIGTDVSIKLALPDGDRGVNLNDEEASLEEIAAQLRGRRICILGTPLLDTPPNDRAPFPAADTKNRSNGPQQVMDGLERTLTDWLGMDVVVSGAWEGHDAEFVICTEPSFAYLEAIRRKRKPNQRAPVTIFIAIDAIEAAALRDDVRVQSKESVVEITIQP